jgi:hypothetical protein
MTSDYRNTSGFIHDILDALERHGYARSDDLHAGHAIELTGDLAHIYEGTQDALPGGYVVVPSPQPTAPQPPSPPGQDAVIVSRDQVTTLLAALDDPAEYKRDPAEKCAGCAGQSCPTCQWRLQAAEASAARQGAPGHAAPPSADLGGRRQGSRTVTRHRTDLGPCRTGQTRQVTT